MGCWGDSEKDLAVAEEQKWDYIVSCQHKRHAQTKTTTHAD